MKTVFTSVIMILSTSWIMSQGNWTKEERNNLYENYLSIIPTKNKEISKEQKESLALCAMNSTCEKYTKIDFASKIEIETKRIYDAQLELCAKNLGISLKQNIQEETKEPVKETIAENIWTKKDKETFVSEIVQYLKKYPHLKEDEVNSLESCCLNQTIESLSKSDYDNMINSEIKNHMDKSITACANKLSIKLTAPVEKVVEKKPEMSPKELLLGNWKTDQGFKISFNSNGTFIKVYDQNYTTDRYTYIKESQVQGDWFIDSKGVITLNEKWTEEEVKLFKSKFQNYIATSKFSITEIKTDFFTINKTEGTFCCNRANSKPILTIQANKIQE